MPEDKRAKNPVHLDLNTTDAAAEVKRLCALGTTVYSKALWEKPVGLPHTVWLGYFLGQAPSAAPRLLAYSRTPAIFGRNDCAEIPNWKNGQSIYGSSLSVGSATMP
ncbi:VOC family protein [Streptomyces monashensis]